MFEIMKWSQNQNINRQKQKLGLWEWRHNWNDRVLHSGDCLNFNIILQLNVANYHLFVDDYCALAIVATVLVPMKGLEMSLFKWENLSSSANEFN